MRHIFGIGGQPATGKTTIMRVIIDTLDEKFGKHILVESVKLVNGLLWPSAHTYIIGKYVDGEVFAGTDKLSMAVQPAALEFIKGLPEDAVVLFEGDRLFNQSFLESIVDLGDTYQLHGIVLTADHEEINRRHLVRKDDQDEKFLKSRRTKYNNILMNMMLQEYISIVAANKPADLVPIVRQIVSTIKEGITHES